MSEDVGKPYDLERLTGQVRPLVVRHVPAIASTNEWARQEVECGLLQGPALLVTDSQTCGRGRGMHTWWSAQGNVAVTFVRPQNQHVAFGLVPLLAGLAVRRALVSLTHYAEIALKWPNDLVVGPRKLAGLLCERLQHFDLIGIGINVNAGSQVAPAELQDRITSLRELTGTVWDLTDIVSQLNQDLDQVFAVGSPDAARDMLQEYSLHHWATGRHIQLVDGDPASMIEGYCNGIDEQGRLVVTTEAGTQALLAGSIVSIL